MRVQHISAALPGVAIATAISTQTSMNTNNPLP